MTKSKSAAVREGPRGECFRGGGLWKFTETMEWGNRGAGSGELAFSFGITKIQNLQTKML